MNLFNTIDLGYAIVVAGAISLGMSIALTAFAAVSIVFRLGIGIIMGLIVLRLLEAIAAGDVHGLI